jgi:PAS domain S-box-containing protein
VVNLTLRYGNIPQVGYSHTAFGGLLGWVDDDYASAKEFGELATRLMTGTFQSPSDQSVFYLMIGSSIRHWFKHLSYGSQDYTDAYEIGLRSGNLQYAAYAFGHNMYCRFYQGVPLAGLIQESQFSLEFSQSRLNQWAIDLLEGGLNIFGILSGESSALDENIDWADIEFLERVDAHHNIQVKCIYKVLKTFALLLSGNNDGALILSDETEPLIYTVGTQGLLPWPEHVFARMLILTALYSKANTEQQIQWRDELDLLKNRLRIWADNCPENFEHKYLLASAELARIDGRLVVAMQLYDQAIESAREGKFIQWKGMANERAFSFWLECGNERLADVYWKQAYICYNRWGADAKVNSMEKEYRVRIAKNIPGVEGSGVTTTQQEQEIKNDLLDRQIKLLRKYALQMQQTKLLNEAETHASELAHATQRLRVEIAERKRAEEALRESEEFSRYILQTIPFGMDIVDENGIVLFQSENLEKHFGDEAIGNKCWCLYRDDKTQCPNCPLRAGINLGITEVYEATGVLGDRIFEITHTGMMFEGKKAMLEVFIDITERKRTEKALRESEERFKKLFVEAPLGIALIDSLTGHVNDVNPMFAKIAGRTLDEMANINWMSITHPDDVQKDLDNMALLNAGKIAGFQMEKRHLHHDGTSVWINMTIAPVYVEDHTQPRHLCMIEDITERRQTQEQIKIQNEELQRINAEINKFFSIIAHDLLVPFNGFLGLTQVMAEELPSLTMAEVQGIAVRMSKSATNLYLLLENLLEWSRIQQGAVPFNPEVIQLGLVFGEIIDVIHESAKSKEIEIATDIPAESGVFADPYMLQTVIRNLVSNAIKFTPKGGKVSLLAKVATDHSVEISIQDTGIGMSQTLIENLFRIDVQTNRKGTEGEPSTGLGLLLCKEFVEKHSGKVWVESEEGIGSTFYFTLPYNIESEEKQVV